MPLVAKLGDETISSDCLGEEDRGKPYTCPNCDKDMIVVLPKWKINHFRHQGSTCNTEPESREHILMKKSLRDALLKWNHEYYIELEKKILMDENSNDFRVADLFLINRASHIKIVVECQASPINENDLLQRTLDYNKQGCAVLWVLSSTFSPFRYGTECRVSNAELVLHQIYYERVYYVDIEESVVYASHFKKAKRANDFYGTTHTLKKTVLVDSEPISDLEIYVTRNVFRIARFKEKKWW